MNLKGIIIGVFVLVVAIGGLIFAARQTVAPTETLEDEAAFMEGESFADPASSSGQLIQREPVMPDETMLEGEGMMRDVVPGSEAEAGDEELLVSMTDLGFEPEEIIIKRGTTVTFVNNGQAVQWPASDVHPTHEILPDFDSQQGLQTGEEYSYTFLEAGAWQYHDHLNAGLTGTVIVEE